MLCYFQVYSKVIYIYMCVCIHIYIYIYIYISESRIHILRKIEVLFGASQAVLVVKNPPAMQEK